MTDMPAGTAPASLGFRAKPRLPIGPLLAIALSGALAAWMASSPGNKSAESQAPHSEGNGTGTASSAQSVEVVHSVARQATRLISADGQTRALRAAQVTARTSGIVEALHAHKGDVLAKGDAILSLSVADFEARAAEAEARLIEARRTAENNTKLNARGLITEDALQSARTQLAAAEAGWAAIEDERDNLTLRAPFAGTLAALDTELGESISNGQQLGQVMDLSSLVVEITVPQVNIADITLGQDATVTPVGGDEIIGRVSFISPAAESATRSFPVEVVIPNAGREIRAGMSASVSIAGRSFQAHEVPSAYLSLSGAGELLVKTYEEGKVKAWPVQVVSFGPTAATVTGLPEETRIITVGQGFVRDGDAVRLEGAQ